MRRSNLLILILLLLGSRLCMAQFSDQELYAAYLQRDMTVWQKYLASVDFDKASVDEQKRYLNYEYGYVAYAVSNKQDNARKLLDTFEKNLETLKPHLAKSTYLAYQASTNSYELSLNRWQFGKYSKLIFNEIDKALSANPNDPLAQTMKGNVEFYSPFGSKQNALKCYQAADSIYHAKTIPAYMQWNVRAVQLTLVQCIEKTSDRQAAIAKSKQVLAEEPNFSLLKQMYAEK